MKRIFDVYHTLWPKKRQELLRELLRDIYVIKLSEENPATAPENNRQNIILINDDVLQENPIKFMSYGFDHIVDARREDFSAEILASSLMILRPDSFSRDPIPYFFNRFSPSKEEDPDVNFTRTFDSSEEKPFLLKELGDFLSQNGSLRAVKDLCLQTADEMVSNALFNAPTDANGNRIYADHSRNKPVRLPKGMKATLFSCFSPQRLVVGCLDPFGSIEKSDIVGRLEEIHGHEMKTPKMNSAGAGLGLSFMVENSSNFYVYCERHKKTLVACSIDLKGKKSNWSRKKHFHVSVR